MLTAVKNQIRVTIKSIKYNIMRQMVNKVTFITNIIFMILNNSTFLIQWIILFNIKENIGGYSFKEVCLLWAITASTYGVAHVTCHKAFKLSDLIINGKLDSFLVQPKNVLISAITSETAIAAIGDFLYGYIVLFACAPDIKTICLFTFFTITGAIIITTFSIIVGSLAFWIVRADMLAESLNSAMIHLGTYPDTIFKNVTKIILYTIIPVGLANHLPIHIIKDFNIASFFILIAVCIVMILLSNIIFKLGLKRYSSSNLMSARN